MKKNILSIVLVLLIIIFGFLKIVNKKEIDPINITTKNKVLEKTNNYVEIYVYNKESKKVEKLELDVDNKEFFNIDYYVKLVLNNSKYLSKNMEMLAVYELDDNKILIKLNEEFARLKSEDFKNLQTSINKTIELAFPDIKEVMFQIDTNN